MPRALAALAVAGVVAGCGIGGSGGGGATTPTTAPSPSSGELAGSQVGSSNRAAGQITPGTAGTLSHQKTGGITKSATGSVSKGQGGKVLSKHDAQKQPTTTTIPTTTTTATTTTTPTTTTNPAKTTTTKTTPAKTTTTQTTPATHTTTTTNKTKKPTTPTTTVRTIIKTKTKVKTVVHTVTKTVRPDVPTGAFLPSTHPVLAQSSFTVAGSNVTCVISSSAIRCAILRRVWAAPVQPPTCRRTWGDTISLSRQGLPQFVCASSKPLSTDATVIPVGYDDKVGDFTCEVRSFGVDCFSPGHSGFLLSRTGYAFY